ncbi:hypothetical protein HRR83_006333 [Exophiala dermatitidis]|uniref:Zn(2)-C6 fungal-type domain-containing protein n=1 Tax=Exophiala dermatitidis (strain ATCC 34100 / CBS 525.76 / NIH/UT8656) TaxID=858893 RepID=H6C9W6_EXODN|nr:uncharacterized protein HMPREF1120_07945 [Exophiala dermatitidis NIH/UT8656]KAJ4507351.1 hypothetical protein HRR75_006700 [Exophiala dermatitidis]EHY59969.1 hypothetical protein HMPREF1120_07945 [Exophiala dermatitidis NIH/UT8656]KAJ4509337.1 hypothetical protein HRR73_007191 [Exophiala dermatitidis]KAJ4509524.1 hypothetical protein HRR74_007305 [Exophiala dermatitidis]KAJ4530525.1 hypothetical protein HRR76_008233 [Exophiala dermatitidis]
MPPKAVKPKGAGPAQRSRTGCQTCRNRKLKCDEAKPICGQCLKSHRECVRSEAITFRHHQNAAFDPDEQDHALDSFFKYAQHYDSTIYFLPVPENLTWIYVTDPDAEDSRTPPPQTETPSESYQQVAAHTLEALSTAAADHISYPPQATAYYTSMPPQDAHPDYAFVRGEAGNGMHGGQGNNINFLLNPPGQTPASLIDPNLEATVAQAAEQAVGPELKSYELKENDGFEGEDGAPTMHEQHENLNQENHEEAMGDSDVAMLRKYNEAQV